jgi:hypothetical protein
VVSAGVFLCKRLVHESAWVRDFFKDGVILEMFTACVEDQSDAQI